MKTEKNSVASHEKLVSKVSSHGEHLPDDFLHAPTRTAIKSPNKHGYPNMWVGNENPGLHVAAYESVYGPIPRDEIGRRTLFVMHLDDNKTNSNPLNLWAGTRAENDWDAFAKGIRPIRAEKLYQEAIDKYADLSRADENLTEDQKIETIAAELKRPVHAIKMIQDVQTRIAANIDEETRDAAFRAFLKIEQQSWCDQRQTDNLIHLMVHKPDILREWRRGDMVDPNPAMDNAHVSDETIRAAALREAEDTQAG